MDAAQGNKKAAIIDRFHYLGFYLRRPRRAIKDL